MKERSKYWGLRMWLKKKSEKIGYMMAVLVKAMNVGVHIQRGEAGHTGGVSWGSSENC